MALSMALFSHALAITGSFTPLIDGTKDAGWGSTPDSTSASGFDGNPATDLYITDDPTYLYILYKYAGDVNNTDSLSSHCVIVIDSTNSYGAGADPWGVSGTTFSSSIKPDFAVRSYYNVQGGAKDVQFTKWNGTSWSGGGAMSEEDHAETIGSWAEVRIPLTTLKIKTGDSINLAQYWRYDQNKAGYSDAVPWNTGASSTSSTGSTISTFYTYTIQADNVLPVITATNPGHTATGLPRNANINFQVTDNKSISPASFTVMVEGNLALTNGSSQSGYAVSITTNTASKDYSVVINPDADFDYLQVVNVSISVKDASGNTSEKTYYFTIAPDTTKPVLNNFNPGVNATGISRNAVVQFQVHDDAQVSQNSIWVKINGVLAYSNLATMNGFSNSVTTLGDGFGYSLTAPALYNFESTIPVILYAKDQAGNTSSTNYSFTITADNIAPTFANASPQSGAVNQAPGINISFQLDDNIAVVSNQIQVRIGSVYLIQNGAFQSGYSGNITGNGNGYDILINPAVDFGYSSNVIVSVTAKDARNNTLNTNWSFTIKNDDVAPTIANRTPAPGASGQLRNVTTRFYLNDDTHVSLSTIDVKINGSDAIKDGNQQSGYTTSIVSSNKGYWVTVNQNALYDYEQAVSVYVYCEDNSANPLSTSYSYSIKSDSVAPTLSAIDPVNNQTGVNKDKIITLTLSDDASLNNSSVVIKLNGSLVLSNGTFSAPYAGPLSSMAGSGSSINISIDALSSFNYRSTNILNITARDSKTNQLTTNITFIVQADNINPTIVNKTPQGSGQLKTTDILFGLRDNIGIKASSLIINFTVTPDGGSASLHKVYTNSAAQLGYGVTLTPDGSGGYDISINPVSDFNYLDYVQVDVSATDLEGNPVSGSWNFSIQGGDTTAPVISRQSPAPGSINIEPDAMIYFETSDDTEVLSNSIQVILVFPGYVTNRAVSNGIFVAPFNGAQSRITTNVNHGYDVNIDYITDFGFLSDYRVIVTVEDNGLNTNSSTWNFTIRPPDTTIPVITAIVPSDGTTDVPIASSISFVIQDNYGIRSNEIQVLLNNAPVITNGVFLPGYQGPGSSILANAAHGFNVIIDPESDFTYGTTLTLDITAVDTSGNTASSQSSFSLQDLEVASARTSVIDPARGTSSVDIKVNRTGYAEVFIYNIRGEQVGHIPQSYYNIGDSIQWDGILEGSGVMVGSGWYFIKVTGSDINAVVKVLVIR